MGTSVNCLNIPFKFTNTIVDRTAWGAQTQKYVSSHGLSPILQNSEELERTNTGVRENITLGRSSKRGPNFQTVISTIMDETTPATWNEGSRVRIRCLEAFISSICDWLPGSCPRCSPEQDCETRRKSQSSTETTHRWCYSDPGQRVPTKIRRNTIRSTLKSLSNWETYSLWHHECTLK